MRILLDECVPKRLKKYLIGHDVATVREMGWTGKKNGELLASIVASGFEVLLTVDQNLKYQQSLRGVPISVLVLVARNNKLSTLIPLVPAALVALLSIRLGDVLEVS